MFRCRLCHGFPSGTGDLKSIHMAVCPCKCQRRNLAQREACYTVGSDARFRKGNGCRQICQIQAGLGILCFLQFFRRAFEALSLCACSEGFCPIEKGFRRCAAFIESLAHTCLLGALSGKNKCYLTHLAAPFSRTSASSMISLMISAAGCSLFTMPLI